MSNYTVQMVIQPRFNQHYPDGGVFDIYKGPDYELAKHLMEQPEPAGTRRELIVEETPNDPT